MGGHSKSKNPEKNMGFEKKVTDTGKNNPKYVDVLEEDKPIAGQKFVCISFISPEKIIKLKEMFFFEEFLKNWEFSKSMEKFIQFLNFLSYKYKLSFDDISTDFKEFLSEAVSSDMHPILWTGAISAISFSIWKYLRICSSKFNKFGWFFKND